MPNTKECCLCGVKNDAEAEKCKKCGGVIFRRIIESYRAKVCVKCQITFCENDNNCPKCGTQLVNCAVPKCVHCGGRVQTFCAGCGKNNQDAFPANNEKEVAKLVHEVTADLLKTANMCLPPSDDTLCLICKSPLKLNENGTCHNCGRYL